MEMVSTTYREHLEELLETKQVDIAQVDHSVGLILSVKEQLEKAYMLTQNIEDGWWNNELVTNISQEEALRSTSVEDIMHINGEKYMVDMVGFKQIN